MIYDKIAKCIKIRALICDAVICNLSMNEVIFYEKKGMKLQLSE